MTRRMVTAVANPHMDVLGHCTGRVVGRGRPGVDVRRRARVRRVRRLRHRGRGQLPSRTARPAERLLSLRRTTGAARSRSTPTPTRWASSSGRRTAASSPRPWGSIRTGSSTRGRSTICCRGPPATPPADRRGVPAPGRRPGCALEATVGPPVGWSPYVEAHPEKKNNARRKKANHGRKPNTGRDYAISVFPG